MSLLLLLFATHHSARAQIFDPTFDAGVDISPMALAIQADGQLLLGGWFSTIGGESRAQAGRLRLDQSLDSDFMLGGDAAGQTPFGWLACPDGQIVMASSYGGFWGGSINQLLRLDGSGESRSLDYWVMHPVYALALQADGKFLGSGYATQLTNKIHRHLNTDGTMDTNFNAFADNSVFNLTMQPDGKILVGGGFNRLNGQLRPAIGRLHSDGSLDTNFAAGSFNYQIQTMLIQPDGKILVGGWFTKIGGQPRAGIARLNPNGTLDAFNPGIAGAAANVNSFALQANGKILVAGDFTSLAGQACTNLGRLNADGSFDTTFSGSLSWVAGVTLQTDGRVLAQGPFNTPGGQTNYLPRFLNTDAVTNALSRTGSTITWQRGGAAPEVWRTTFEASTNGGASWFDLGPATRIAGGWQLTDVSLPPSATIRARGYHTGSFFNSSSSITEAIIGPPVIVSQPSDKADSCGASVRFFSPAGGSEPLTYQWRRFGTNLVEASEVIGTHTSLLTLSNIFGGRDQGDYTLIASNAFGSVTSQVANLTIYEPSILAHPVAVQRVHPGQTATLSVTALGTPPLSYQWRKDGTNIAGATQSSLVFSNAQFSDNGTYEVIVSTAFGEAGSSLSSLVVSFVEPDSLVGISKAWNQSINCVVPLADGRLLVGGAFAELAGHSCTNLARINIDGSVDTTFHPNPVDSWGGGFVYNLTVQPDGKILVRGGFEVIGGLARTNFARLNADGSVDSSFIPNFINTHGPLAVQADGKIIITTFDADTNRLIRLNPNGTSDPSLSALVIQGPWAGNINALALAEDGKILVGGAFTQIAGQPRTNLARFNANGTLDSGFTASVGGYGDFVLALAIQGDGKVIVGGYFSLMNGTPQAMLGRLHSDGTSDEKFPLSAEPFMNQVNEVALQSDGKILVAGWNSKQLTRLNPDGSLDASFNVGLGNDGSSPSAHGVRLAFDGKVLVLGTFSTVNGLPRAGFCRLFNDPVAQTLDPDGSTITWLRGGSSPEVWRTTFDYSTNGTSWILLGNGTRIDGGWQMGSVGLPANSTLRARGFVNGGDGQWFVEDSVPVGLTLFPSGNQASPFSFQVRVVPGKPVVIEGSTNLVHWTALHTNPPATTNRIYFSDPNSTLFPHRFYRAHWP